MDYNIRKFTAGDGQAVIDVFNYFVENGYAAYPDNKVGQGFIEKLKEVVLNGSFYVVETSAGKLIGFGLLRKHHVYEVFERTAELTYFILPDHTRRGLGSRLLSILVSDAREVNVDTLLANISSRNEVSIMFHKKHWFVECGKFRRIGKKNGADFDVVWMQRFI